MMKFAFTSLTVMTTLICYSSALEAGRFWSFKSDDDKTAGTRKPPHFVYSIDFKRINESDIETRKLNLEGLTDDNRTKQVANALKELKKLEKKYESKLKNGKDLPRNAQTEMDEYIAILIANEMIEKEIQKDTETRRRTILQTPLNAGDEADFSTNFPPINLNPFSTNFPPIPDTEQSPSSRSN